jgi:hypothetical protein
MTLSNAADIVLLAAMIPVLLRVNLDRNGRPVTMPIREKQPLVVFSLKMIELWGCQT